MSKKKVASMATQETAAVTLDLDAQTPDSAAGTVPDNNPSYEEVSALAYKYWQERGCPEGSDQEDWFRAESELTKNATPASVTCGSSSK